MRSGVMPQRITDIMCKLRGERHPLTVRLSTRFGTLAPLRLRLNAGLRSALPCWGGVPAAVRFEHVLFGFPAFFIRRAVRGAMVLRAVLKKSDSGKTFTYEKI
jgi:hypothetical protein